jgi:hypothetical protein
VTRVRLDLGGAEMEFDGVLRAMRGAYDVLLEVQGQVLGPRAAPRVHWILVGLQAGSAVAELEARPEDSVSADLVNQVADAYVRGIHQWAHDPSIPPPYFNYDAIARLRDLATGLGRYGTGPLMVVHADGPTQPRGFVPPMEPDEPIPDPISIQPAQAERSRGSIIGRIEAINLHERREATLYDEVDHARVVLVFPEDMFEQVRQALRRRVEASGEIIEDEAGRPTRVRLEELEVLPGDEELRPLADLVGLFPDLTDGQDPTEWIREQRREGGHG